MATAAANRFARHYQPIADAISRADIGQVEREQLAEDMAEALAGIVAARPNTAAPGWDRALFVGIARDPMCECPGYTRRSDDGHVPCTEQRWIRVAMHLSSAVDGRSAAWRQDKPAIQCVTCGAMDHVAGFQENVLARA